MIKFEAKNHISIGDRFRLLMAPSFDSDFICILIRILPWVFLQGQNIEIWLFIFLCLGTPSGIEKKFLSVILISCGYFDRTRCVDHEYHIFIKIWSSNKKIIKDFPYMDDIIFLLGNNAFSPLCPWKVHFGVLQWLQYHSIFCHLSRSGRIFKNITYILCIIASCQAQFCDIHKRSSNVHIP